MVRVEFSSCCLIMFSAYSVAIGFGDGDGMAMLFSYLDTINLFK